MNTTLRSQFIRHLLDLEILEALLLLQSTLDIEDDGHELVLEFVTAWQDLIDSSGSPFSPLLECLEHEDEYIVLTSIRLINELILKSSDPSKIFRMIHELRELRYDKHLQDIELRFEDNKQIISQINIWHTVQDNRFSQSISPVTPLNAGEMDNSDMNDSGDYAVFEDLCKLDLLSKANTMKIEDNFDSSQVKINSNSDNDKTNGSLPVVIPPPPPPPPFLKASINQATPPAPPPPPPIHLLNGAGPGIPPPPPLEFQQIFGASKPIELPESMRPKRIRDNNLHMVNWQWDKIPTNVAIAERKDSVWNQLRNKSQVSLDYDMLESMYSLPTRTKRNVEQIAILNKKKETVVDLLSPKRSQNVSITLKRFKNLDGLISNLRENHHRAFDIETLRTLKQMLPDSDEVEALGRYTGDVSMLAPPCAFFLQMLSISDYSLRIDCMLYRLEFTRIIDETLPQLNLLLKTCNDIADSEALRRLFLILVNIGNYLNGSTAQGNAAGFKLNSLWRMIDLKAAKGQSTIFHVISKTDKDLLQDLEKELPNVQKAAQISSEELRCNLRQLSEQGIKLKKQLDGRTETHFVEVLLYLNVTSHNELEQAEHLLDQMSCKTKKLANYFCENPNTFKIDDCLKIFNIIIQRLHIVVQENKNREEREAKKAQTSHNNDEQLTGEGKENPDVIRRSESYGQQQLLYQTLESGSNNSWWRRRSSQRNALDVAREREGQPKLRRMFRESEGEDKKSEDASLDAESKPNTELSPEITRIIRRPRASIHYANTNNLSDYIQSLQDSVTPTKPPTKSDTVPEIDEQISVTIPNESDGCVSTPGSSPKSASDEGFESEKDKESPLNSSNCQSIPSDSMKNRKVSLTKKHDSSKPTKMLNSIKPPKLISITTTSLPTKTATESGGTTSSPQVPSTNSRRLPLQKQKDVESAKPIAQTSSKLSTERSKLPRPTVTAKLPNKLRTPLVDKLTTVNTNARNTNATTSSAISTPTSTTALPGVSARRASMASQRSTPVTTMSTVLKTPTTPKLLRKNSQPERTGIPQAGSRQNTLRRSAAVTNCGNTSRPSLSSLSSSRTTGSSSGSGSSMDVKTPSVSTSSRPALIKTGSINQRPNIRGLEAVEKPKPLKKTLSAISERTKGAHPTPSIIPKPTRSVATTGGLTKPQTCRPKWV